MNKYLTIMLCILFLACKKGHLTDTVAATNLQVPPFTEVGANTFGCYVDDKAWANFGAQYISGAYSNQPAHYANNVVNSSLTVDANGDSLLYISGELTVQKNGTVTRDEIMSVGIPKNGNLKGTHLLTAENSYFTYRNNLNGSQNYYSLASSPFVIEIYKDSIAGSKHIVSGKFYGSLHNIPANGVLQPDSVQITGGVFDISLKIN